MNGRTPTFCEPPLVETEAEVVKCNVVDIEPFAIGSVYGDQLRGEVQHLPQFCLLLTDSVFRPLPILAIGKDAIPLDKVTSPVTKGDATLQIPAILPVRRAETGLAA